MVPSHKGDVSVKIKITRSTQVFKEMQFNLVMRNEHEDAERRHRSRNCFLDYCPSVS